ncbi:MAG: CatB-related O-acetyltransferase [Hyphomicrobiales bacterium]
MSGNGSDRNLDLPVLGPDPKSAIPIAAFPQLGFLKPLVENPRIQIGDYSYYDDPDGPEHFVEKCVKYHFDFIGDNLIIGRFCAIATGVQFIMNGANHPMDGLSTYPFAAMGGGWELGAEWPDNSRGDTVVGNDVWIGREAMILPGTKIGDGAIVGSRAVVTRDVPPYAVVAGNPARVVKQRFEQLTVDRLRQIAWWDWDAEKITRNLDAIRGLDLDALEQVAGA